MGSAAHISARAIIREPSRITIGSRSTIGRAVELNPQGGTITIGADSSLQNGCVIYGAGGVAIGDDCRIANGTILIAFNHCFEDPGRPIRTQGITSHGIVIEQDVWIGARAVILDGVTIGRGAVIGAGAVVTRDIPAHAIAVGVPARVIASRN